MEPEIVGVIVAVGYLLITGYYSFFVDNKDGDENF